ncbi:hypothetical protein SBA4_1640019 [Candidatus Sulfopaludibacter sp. SbA4]|nr:hypothetical protein SBA4_1640019 [Candidatus Sulfopaludibacter sp. SbA4]
MRVPMSGGRSLAGATLAAEISVIEERRLKRAAGSQKGKATGHGGRELWDRPNRTR